MGNKLQSYGMIFFAFITPLLALFAPLALAPIFIIIALYPTYLFLTKCQFKNVWKYSDVNKVIIILLSYSLISTVWALKPAESINLWFRMLLFFIGALGLFAYIPQILTKEKILQSLFCGIIVTLVFVNIEIFTGGVISKLFGIGYKVSHKFELVIFNRGASILSIFSWAVICYLCAKKNYKAALLFFIIVLATLVRLQSLSTLIGFALSGLFVFPVVFYTGTKALKAFAVLAVIAVFAVATGAAIMDAHKLVGRVPVVSGAASDIRLYIWDYAAKQAMQKPLLGWGLNASRSYPVQESDYVQGGRNPLPLHPHNNTLQIWLELGAVGLIIFATFLAMVLLRISKTAHLPYIAATCTSLFANYFIIGQTGYGIWQNWWVGSGILAVTFLQLGINNKQ